MRKILNLSVAFVLVWALNACAVNDKSEEVKADFPSDRDAGAQFFAAQKNEPWLFLNEGGSGDRTFINTNRVVQDAATGNSKLWQKLVFATPVPLKQSEINYTLMYTEVSCANRQYRTTAYYAVSDKDGVLEVSENPNVPFHYLDTGSVALSIYRFACER